MAFVLYWHSGRLSATDMETKDEKVTKALAVLESYSELIGAEDYSAFAGSATEVPERMRDEVVTRAERLLMHTSSPEMLILAGASYNVPNKEFGEQEYETLDKLMKVHNMRRV